MGEGNGCLLGGGEGVRGGVVFAFLFCGLEGRGPCSLRRLLGFSLEGGISDEGSSRIWGEIHLEQKWV